jgi:hypothetical protein
MSRYNNIHRQQLFHWIGSHIDYPYRDEPERRRPRLDDEHRREYVRCLEGALQHGLWVNTPRVPDQLGDGQLVKVTRPIVCFTEWSLGESLPHTTRYGRLGLGFPKRFVLECGGQPVTYVRDRRRADPFTASVLHLARLFRHSRSLAGVLAPAELEAARRRFDYLTHFVKRLRRQVTRRAGADGNGGRSRGRIRRRAAVPDAGGPYEREFGRTLHYLEEREWRIAHDETLAEFFQKGSQPPDYFLRFVPGRQLFTLVLPDNRTVNLVLQNRRLVKALFPKGGPHVTVLSLQDIGTF